MMEKYNYQTLLRPVLEVIKEHQPIKAGKLTALAVEKIDLTPEQKAERLKTGALKANNTAAWALSHLYTAGLVDRPTHGVYEITEEGERLLASSEGQIDKGHTLIFGASGQGSQSDRKLPNAIANDPYFEDKSPHQLIDELSEKIDRALQDELLEAIRAQSPQFLEKLIVDLLIAMGYGGGRAEMGEALGQSGDNGIDGVVREDELGLDVVYLQAKRYQLGNGIGRPDIQSFVGAMTGESANKGVFVTTSHFSSQARDYVTKISQRVVLIDGDELTRLMIRHKVGVRVRASYDISKLDEDFFAE